MSSQIRSIKPVDFERRCKRRCDINPPLPSSPDHRSYTFPVQWLSLRNSRIIPCPGAEAVYDTAVRPDLCSAFVLQAHIPLPCARIRCVSPSNVLPQPQINPTYPFRQLPQISYCAWPYSRCSFWAVSVPRPDRPNSEPTISLLTRPLPRVLGA